MKLRELKKWTKVRFKTGEIIEFLGIGWGFAFGRWKYNDNILTMWWANQDVSEFWEVLDDNF